MIKRSFFKIVTVSLLMIVSFAGCSFSAEPEELERLIMQAKEANPLISAAEERVIQAQGALQEAGAKMGPKFGVGVAGIWPRDRIIPIDGLPLGFGNVYVAAAGFVQTIYAGGSLIASKEAAQLAIDTAKAEKERISQTVANSVSIAYYNWRRACAKKAVAEEALKLAKDHLGRAEKLFVSGVVARGDVLRSKVAVADAELALIRSDNAVDLSLTALERAVGSRPEVTETADAATGYVPSPEALSDRESNIKAAYENRLEIKMYDLMSRRANKIAKAAEGRLLPQIMAAGAIMNAGNDFFPSGNEEAVLSLIGTWTIYDSNEASAKTKQARAQAREFLHLIDDMKNTIKMEVTNAELDLRSSISRLEVARRQTAESEEDYRIAVRRYEEQVGTNLEMLDARLALTKSRTEAVDAYYDILIAEANLRCSMGK
ncbi:MAG TPA: TolC family protein [Synergistaceae bacterium]|jgi:outer membrane protein TolC|nr:TolC family protein [Synergistaceae bacterium]NLL40478.1 TolC family protein [Synergistaceae bacterium]HPX03551.1 TolC family protein [Synergistaceae bacterium]HQA54540.1 TolC family protein [Synergistaceae bacterium]